MDLQAFWISLLFLLGFFCLFFVFCFDFKAIEIRMPGGSLVTRKDDTCKNPASFLPF